MFKLISVSMEKGPKMGLDSIVSEKLISALKEATESSARIKESLDAAWRRVSDFDDLQSRVAVLEASSGTVSATVSTVDKRMSTLELQVSTLEERVKHLTQSCNLDLDAIKAKFSRLEATVVALSKRVDRLHRVSLRSHSGKFVCAVEHGSGPLIADRPRPLEWETFTLVPV